MIITFRLNIITQLLTLQNRINTIFRLKMTQLLVIILLITLTYSQTNTHPLQLNYERLVIEQNHFRLEFSLNSPHPNIPHSLIHLLNTSSINYLALSMGFINPSIHNQLNTKSQQTSIPSIYHGISLILKNTSEISLHNFKSIAQVFSISRSPQFITYLNQSSLLYIKNPNDKFCSQHLKSIIDTFLPCKNKAGIASIINQKTFFLSKDFVAMNIQWSLEQKIKIVFILDKETDEVKNYLKQSPQKRNSRRCMHFDKLDVFTQNQKGSLDQKLDQNIPMSSFQNIPYFSTSSLSVSFGSNYYNPLKLLNLEIDIVTLIKQIQIHQGSVSPFRIKARLSLPKGFKIQKISYNCERECIQLVEDVIVSLEKVSIPSQQKFSIISSFDNYHTLAKFTIMLKNNLSINSSLLNSSSHSKLMITLQYQSNLKPFQEYQNIAGQGQEMMNIPLVVEFPLDKSILIWSNQMSNLFDRLLEPDFSIPFKTITFTVAILGYVWIAIWKAFFTQMSETKRINNLQNQRLLDSSSKERHQTNQESKIHLIDPNQSGLTEQ